MTLLAVHRARSLHSTKSDTDSESEEAHPQAVAVFDLVDGQYTTSADVDLMVIPLLLCLLISLRTNQWSSALMCITRDFMLTLTQGPGMLRLIQRTAVHSTESDLGPGCAVLMDDGIIVVIQSSQEVVEAVTEGGFSISFADPKPAQGVISVTDGLIEKQDLIDIW